MKNIIGILIAIVILGGLIFLARPKPTAQNGAVIDTVGTALAADMQNYDFGTISMAAGNVMHEFKIKNTGSSPVTIEKMYTSCMCTTASLALGGRLFGPYGMPGHMSIPRIGETIGPDEEATVEVIFDPAAHGPAGVGRIERAVIIENSAGKPLELQFSAMVTP